MEEIRFTGLKELDEKERGVVNKLSAEYHEKIKRAIKNITSLHILIKIHKKTGNRKKYDVHVTVVAPTRAIESKAADWDLARTLHMVFNRIEKEIQHRFHSDTSFRKKRG